MGDGGLSREMSAEGGSGRQKSGLGRMLPAGRSGQETGEREMEEKVWCVGKNNGVVGNSAVQQWSGWGFCMGAECRFLDSWYSYEYLRCSC